MLMVSQLDGFGVYQDSGGPIGTPVGIGSINKSTSSSTTATGTTGANILTGDCLVVAISTLGTTVNAFSDSVNSFSLAKRQQNGTASLEFWYYQGAAAVGSGATFTVTFAGATLYCSAGLVRVPGASLSAALDQAVSDTTLPITTGTLAQALEVVFGAVGGFNFTSVTEDAAFTQLYNINNGGEVSLGLGYKATAATTAVSYNPTVTGTGGNLCYAAAAFK